MEHPQQHMNLEGGDELQGEKQSVLKKVKAKAKKLKDTIKKHGHGHDHDHHRELDEDEDEHEELEGDPEVHGAPIYESQTARNPMVGSEESQGMHHQPILERTDEPAVAGDHTKLGIPTSLGREGLSVLSLEEDRGAPKQSQPGNYQAKVSDPTGAGAEEMRGIGPLLGSRGKVADKEANAAEPIEPAGSDDRPGKYKDIPEDSPLVTGEAASQDIGLQGGYGEKLAYATAALADKAVAAKDAAAGKLGYDAQSDQTSYKEKAAQAASLLAGKAAGVKDAVAVKLGFGGAGEHEHKTPREPVDHEGLMERNQSYADKISGVTSAVAEKAVEAKNAVVSKLGYEQESASAARPSQHGLGTETTTWAEKLKPGEEDKALGELISDAVYKNESTRQEGASEVTKSPVAEKIKVAVSSWWSSGDETQAQPRVSHTGAGERSLQESAN